MNVVLAAVLIFSVLLGGLPQQGMTSPDCACPTAAAWNVVWEGGNYLRGANLLTVTVVGSTVTWVPKNPSHKVTAVYILSGSTTYEPDPKLGTFTLPNRKTPDCMSFKMTGPNAVMLGGLNVSACSASHIEMVIYALSSFLLGMLFLHAVQYWRAHRKLRAV